MTLLETLLVMACLSCVAAAGLLVAINSQSAAKATKLKHDVAVLNSSIRTYLASGGTIEINTGDGAIRAIKRQAAAGDAMKIAGLSGSMIDRRLEGVAVQPGEAGLRAVWDPALKQFSVAETGSGYKEFALNPDAAELPAEDTRKSSFALGTETKWVWDHEQREAAPKTGRMMVAKGVGAIKMPALGSTPRGELLPPKFSLTGGYYSYSDLKNGLALRLTNPNTDATSQIYYSIGNGAWTQYEGGPISLAGAFTTAVRAYAISFDSESWTDSEVVAENYETVWFSGSNAGEFYSPAGDNRMKTNLTGSKRDSYFEWGDPANGYIKPNSLKFAGASFDHVAPDEQFLLGTLTYFNGTTFSNTNATSVKIDMNLNLTEPVAKEKLTFTFKLLSTTNQPNKSDDQNADYVYIPTISTSFNTTISGRKYYLKLSFGSHGANGFTTIDTFHTHENKTMSGGVYGRLTTTP